MALIPIARDEVATVVTTLTMDARPRPAPMPPSTLRLVRWDAPPAERYRALFRRVGGPWLWFSRLVMDDAALDAVLADPGVRVFAAVDRTGVELGMLELDFRRPALCQIAYLGLVPERVGRGDGRWLMANALALGWVPGVERMQVNTCTLDHPRALGFYRRAGFVPVARTIETFADPRAAGILPADTGDGYPRLASRR